MMTMNFNTKNRANGAQRGESKVRGRAVRGFTLLVQLSCISRHYRGKRKQKGRHYSMLVSKQ